jgi:hypothetical protein
MRRLGTTMLGLMVTLSIAACGESSEGPSTFGDGVQKPDPSVNPFSGTRNVCLPIEKLRLASGNSACAASGYGGRAKVAEVKVLVLDASAVDTGELPATGGKVDSTLLTVDVGSVLHSSTASAKVETARGTTARAAVENLSLSVLGIGISADVIDANASAECAPEGVQASGSSIIANLKIAGATIAITGAPNQSLDVGGLIRVVINEQVQTKSGIVVRALHVSALSALNVADVVVSSADARVSCTNQCTSSEGTGSGSNPGSGDPGSGGTPIGGGPSGGTDSHQGIPGGGKTGDPCDAATPCAVGYTCTGG